MTDLSGKVFLFTGATDGIGKAALTDFAKRSASITIIGRNKEKTKSIVSALKLSSGNNNINFQLCDLSRVADVRHIAEKFKENNNRLDVLINNAGTLFSKPSISPEGFELTFVTNYLSHFMLTNSLLELIRQTPDARVVSTSSVAHAKGKIDLRITPTDLANSGLRAYATSKLAIILFTKELQRQLEGSTAIANCFHPGIVRSKFGLTDSGFRFPIRVIVRIAMIFAKSPQQGADSLIWLATSPEAGSLKGEYVINRQRVSLSDQANDPKLAGDLWKLSMKICSDIMNYED